MKRFIFAFLLCLCPLSTVAAEEMKALVTHVIDGDTFVTQKGDHVRLLGINTPERGRDNRPAEPYSAKATERLANLIDDKTVTLVFDTHRTDRYKRLLAHVYLADGTWVNKKLIDEGLAHVYSFADNRAHIQTLLTAEQMARDNQIGLWSTPRWRTRNVDDTFGKKEIGSFYIVRGVVKNTATVRGTTYLNFGEDWRTDFTAEIIPGAEPLFTEHGLPPLSYKGLEVEVRGVIKPVNGIMISVSHPEQIQILSRN